MKNITIIIPVHNESYNLHKLYERLLAVTIRMPKYKWEYVFVNDGSSDNSFEIIRELCSLSKNNKAMDFSRNFGKEVALTAGVCASHNSDAVICIDADLQHPPELLPKLVNEWNKGFEVVSTIRISNNKQPVLRKYGSRFFYWIMSKISSIDMASQTTDFGLYDNKVIKAFCLVTERDRIFRGVVEWMGFKKTHVTYIADARNSGESSFSYSKLYKLAVSSIASFSLWPLKIVGYFGVIITLFSGVMLVIMAFNYLFSVNLNYTPIAVVVVANTFLIGLVLISLGLMAVYIGRIHTEAINRPLYIIAESLNYD